MGNAVWRGVRLKHVLPRPDCGADGPVLDKTPDFVKSIPLWKGLDENTIIAYQMNGQPPP